VRLKMVLPGILLLAGTGACANGPAGAIPENPDGVTVPSASVYSGWATADPVEVPAPSAPAPSAPAPSSPAQTSPADPAKLGKSVWTEPAEYSFTLTSSCGERPLLGKFQATVSQGKIVKVRGLDDPARRALMLRLAELVPTMGLLEAQAETARNEGGKVKIVRAADKHPTRIDIDRDPNAVDDEACYTIEDYTIG
jgi:hypothetical protein